MRITFIRHGFTAGNREKRYIGRTDEPLCAEGISELLERTYPTSEVVVSSLMRRCLETAKIIYPNVKIMIVNELRECDFGDFEGKNYTELSSDSRYQAWIDSGGEMAFPNGESPREFRQRCCDGFLQAVDLLGSPESAAFVVHGGTIMAILDRFSAPHRNYFDWQCDNGGGYVCQWNGKKLKVTEKL